MMKPEICPYCGEKRLEELQPTEVVVDDMLWTIYHYECQFCTEVFDKIIPEGDLEFDVTEEELERLTSGEDNEKKFRN